MASAAANNDIHEDKELITPDEIRKLGEALKDDNFRKLFLEYAEEMNDPENRKKYEEELKIFERERGMEVSFIYPEGNYVMKTVTEGEQQRKIFINVCSNKLVEKPNCSRVEAGLTTPAGLNWNIPYFLSKPQEDLDKAGKPCTVYDTVFHGDTLYMAQKNPRFRKMVEQTALDGIEEKFHIIIRRENIQYPKMKYKGKPIPSVIRKKIETTDEVDGDDDDSNGNQQFLNEEQKENEEKTPGRDVLASEERVVVVRPKYTIKQRSTMDMEDYTVLAACSPNIRPKELVVLIELPQVGDVDKVELDLHDRLLKLISHEKISYDLTLDLPYPIYKEQGRAKYSSMKKVLQVLLKVVSFEAEQDMKNAKLLDKRVMPCNKTPVNSRENQEAEDVNKENSDTEEIKQNADVDEDEIKEFDDVDKGVVKLSDDVELEEMKRYEEARIEEKKQNEGAEIDQMKGYQEGMEEMKGYQEGMEEMKGYEENRVEEMNLNEDAEKEMKRCEKAGIEEAQILETKENEDVQIGEMKLYEDAEIKEIKQYEEAGIEKMIRNEDDRIEEMKLNEQYRIEEMKLNEQDRIEEIKLNEEDRIEEMKLNEEDRIEERKRNEDDRIEEVRLNEDDRIEEMKRYEDDRIEKIKWNEDAELEMKESSRLNQFQDADKDHKDVNDLIEKYHSEEYNIARDFICNQTNETFAIVVYLKNVRNNSVKAEITNCKSAIFMTASTEDDKYMLAFKLTERFKMNDYKLDISETNIVLKIGKSKPMYYSETIEFLGENGWNDYYFPTENHLINTHLKYKDQNENIMTSSVSLDNQHVTVKDITEQSVTVAFKMPLDNVQKVKAERPNNLDGIGNDPRSYFAKFKERTSSESSEDLSPMRRYRGILKHSGNYRSISESSDDFGWNCQDMVSPESDCGDSSDRPKKSVRFSENISRSVFRANSSILGQKKKNQKRNLNKKKSAAKKGKYSGTSGSESEGWSGMSDVEVNDEKETESVDNSSVETINTNLLSTEINSDTDIKKSAQNYVKTDDNAKFEKLDFRTSRNRVFVLDNNPDFRTNREINSNTNQSKPKRGTRKQRNKAKNSNNNSNKNQNDINDSRVENGAHFSDSLSDNFNETETDTHFSGNMFELD